MKKVKLSIVGVGNCASALVQSLSYCQEQGENAVGISLPVIGGYKPEDIEITCAFDVDSRKVGKTVGEAVFSLPNCTHVFHQDLSDHSAVVHRGPDFDGVSAHMLDYPEDRSFCLSELPALSKDAVVSLLKSTGTEVILIFLPVGSERAAKFYAECALEAGCAVVNGIPVFLASDTEWAGRFKDAGLPILGDDFKAQFGATIVHRALTELAESRGVKIDRTYQLNVGGNTDFLNMQNPDRLLSKRESKTEAVQATMNTRLKDTDIRIGPSDYVPWLQDRKVAHIRLEGRLLGGVPTQLDVRLEVEDSPNAAAEALIAIRCAKIALDRGLSGPIEAACAFLFKHPPTQMHEADALVTLKAFGATD
jgi:myo-inositol-1-phosphate synthase